MTTRKQRHKNIKQKFYKREKKNYPVYRKENAGHQNGPTNKYIPDIFSGNAQNLNGILSNGRIHYSTSERTAVYIDNQGNKTMLSERTTMVNAPETFKGGISCQETSNGKKRKFNK